MSGHDRFDEGCIPVPDTSRLLLLGSYTARSCSGIWIEPGLHEVLRLRPGVLGNESFKSIHAMPDGTVIVNTLNKGDALYRAEDFWNFLRTSSRAKKLGYWLNYPKPYPDREYELPPLSEDVTLMFAPPFVESQPTISPVAKPQPTRSVKTGPAEASETQATDGV